ncbi:MAG TPA: hypothetical protein VHW23_04555 [Kofleriaceae bacterium]|nr:hypothetical protein [Kofleriaceae bacterium]
MATAQPGSSEDKDLDLIPSDLPAQNASSTPPERRTRTLEDRRYVAEAVTLGTRRSLDVPFPSPLPYDRQNRTSLDITLDWKPAARFALVLSDRPDVLEQDGQALWSRQTVRNALRDGYASWEPFTRSYLELGRINVRDGAALGFSPTDFFRSRTLVGQTSLDPSVLRLNRLGTLMVRAQTIWNGGSASLLYAPKLFAPSAIATSALGIDPRFDATNATHRVLAETSTNVGDLSAQVLGYYEPHRAKLGLNLTYPLGQSIIAYAEWAGGFDQNLIARAIDYGQATGTLPTGAPPPIPSDPSRAFRNDAAVGGSWTIAAKVTVNLEYHLHQGGLSRGDWDRWFAAGEAMPKLAGELWYIRGYAADQIEPVAMHQVFVRADWPQAFVDHLALSGFAFVSLLDGSTLSQITASYYLSDVWTATLSFAGNVGPPRSERGSIPQIANGIAEIIRYF